MTNTSSPYRNKDGKLQDIGKTLGTRPIKKKKDQPMIVDFANHTNKRK